MSQAGYGKEFMLCYATRNTGWKCETGHKTVEDIDNIAKTLREKDINVTTTFFPVFTLTPNYILTKYAQSKLLPTVRMVEKSTIS